VVFKLVGDITGPDGSSLPLGEARIIAAAQGSLTDSRALFRLTTLSLRLPDGRRKVLDIDGWVVGEDGLRGMEGILVDPIGKAIGAAGFIGAVGGLGQATARAQTTNFIDRNGNAVSELDGDVAAFVAGEGVERASREWERILRERLRKLVPHVQVFSGREATAVFSKSVAIKGLFEQLEDENDIFSSLD
jgi:hypothetical protein